MKPNYVLRSSYIEDNVGCFAAFTSYFLTHSVSSQNEWVWGVAVRCRISTQSSAAVHLSSRSACGRPLLKFLHGIQHLAQIPHLPFNVSMALLSSLSILFLIVPLPLFSSATILSSLNISCFPPSILSFCSLCWDALPDYVYGGHSCFFPIPPLNPSFLRRLQQWFG